MQLQQRYNEAWQSYQLKYQDRAFQDEVRSQSKRLFLLCDEAREKWIQKNWSSIRVAEMGSGLGGAGQWMSQAGAQVELFDFSPQALSLAEALYQSQKLTIRTFCQDVTLPFAEPFFQRYDLILDSHLLHCLTDHIGRMSYLQSLRELLAPGGCIVGECMVSRKKMFIPEGFEIDAFGTLYQKFSSWVPVRLIRDSLELEEELKKAGFQIRYYMYYANFNVTPSKEFFDVPAELLPASVRFHLTCGPTPL
jgi:SAM-dependent methyltransferase